MITVRHCQDEGEENEPLFTVYHTPLSIGPQKIPNFNDANDHMVMFASYFEEKYPGQAIFLGFDKYIRSQQDLEDIGNFKVVQPKVHLFGKLYWWGNGYRKGGQDVWAKPTIIYPENGIENFEFFDELEFSERLWLDACWCSFLNIKSKKMLEKLRIPNNGCKQKIYGVKDEKVV